jgi:hypothetical protein
MTQKTERRQMVELIQKIKATRDSRGVFKSVKEAKRIMHEKFGKRK